MMPVIIPAILPKTKEELRLGLKKIKPFSKWVQIDIADGIFVNNKTVPLQEIDCFLLKDFFVEFHLMVEKPDSYLINLCKLAPKKVFIHFETLKKNQGFGLNQRKEFGFEIGLAINPETKIKDFKDAIPYFDRFLFLSVNPGFQGQKFIDKVVFKIKEFKKNYPFKKISVDGGVNNENIKKIYKAGVDEIVVGSFILKNQFPQKAFFQLFQLLKNTI